MHRSIHIIPWIDRDARRLYEKYRRREDKRRRKEQGHGGTCLDNLALLCPFHHGGSTWLMHRGWLGRLG
jgi:hypothetical protein